MQAKTHDTTTTRGREAEALAARHLECCGLRVIERNFRIRGGEIDLICRDGKTLVFVEVRLRSRTDFGGAGASITVTKQRRIILAAQHYLLGKAGLRLPFRLCSAGCSGYQPPGMDQKCVFY
jgi:putative endonuclease